MALRIIGAGFGRTGTLSVKLALEKLGFSACYHMAEVFSHPGHAELWLRAWRGEAVWAELFDGFSAAVDWPVAAFWHRLMDYYPNARVLLTLRDGESWYRSASNTIFSGMEELAQSKDPERRERIRMANEIIRKGTFGERLFDRDHAIAVYEANVAAVRAEVPPDRLIEYRASDGWEPLCHALDVPLPKTPFPNINTTEEFHSRWRPRESDQPRRTG